MMELDQPPYRSHHLLHLPLDFESFPSKRHRFISSGTHTSTVHTCDSTRMSTESSLQNTRSPSNPIPTIVNGSPSTPVTSMVVVLKAPIITMARPILNDQATTSNHFRSLGHSPGYNFHSIPMASSPFSYGIPNFTSHFLNSIPTVVPNASIGLGGNTPPYNTF
jgi:hypothetical protein